MTLQSWLWLRLCLGLGLYVRALASARCWGREMLMAMAVSKYCAVSVVEGEPGSRSEAKPTYLCDGGGYPLLDLCYLAVHQQAVLVS